MLDVNATANLTTPDLAAGAQLDNAGADPQILLVTSYVDALGFADADGAVGATVRIGIADYTGAMHEVVATVAGVQNETILASGAALNEALIDRAARGPEHRTAVGHSGAVRRRHRALRPPGHRSPDRRHAGGSLGRGFEAATCRTRSV